MECGVTRKVWALNEGSDGSLPFFMRNLGKSSSVALRM